MEQIKPTKEYSTMMHFRINQDIYDMVRILAFENKVPKNVVLNTLLVSALKEEPMAKKKATKKGKSMKPMKGC